MNYKQLPAPPKQLQMDDIQGLILRGYNFPKISYLIFNIPQGNESYARNLCADLLPGSGKGLSVTDASPWVEGIKPEYCLNVGFTYQGMVSLIGAANCTTLNNTSSSLFSSFKAGATEPNQAINIGDTGASAPANWWKRSGGWLPGPDPDPAGNDLHIQITLYTHTDQLREQYYAELLDMIPKVNDKPVLTAVFYQDSDPITVDGDDNYVHFGYKDSLSQPRIDHVLWNETKVRKLTGVSTIDDRPKVDPDYFVINPNAPKKYPAHPFLKNGTFAAFRMLNQDVPAFEQFINSDKENTDPELLAAKMCGRWRDGTPLVVSPMCEDKNLKDFDYTNFNYLKASANQQGSQTSDDDGAKCPYAAHIRRTNPRDDYKVTGNQNLQSLEPPVPLFAAKNRVLRRASPYGPVYNELEPISTAKQRGLIGLFMGASIYNQFQFIMQLWMENGGFRSNYYDPNNPSAQSDLSPNQSGIDPMFGPQAGDPNPNDLYFSFNDNGTYKNIPIPGNANGGFSRFIRTDGSMYLFFPGLLGLKFLSEGTIPDTPV